MHFSPEKKGSGEAWPKSRVGGPWRGQSSRGHSRQGAGLTQVAVRGPDETGRG